MTRYSNRSDIKITDPAFVGRTVLCAKSVSKECVTTNALTNPPLLISGRTMVRREIKACVCLHASKRSRKALFRPPFRKAVKQTVLSLSLHLLKLSGVYNSLL